MQLSTNATANADVIDVDSLATNFGPVQPPISNVTTPLNEQASDVLKIDLIFI